MVIELYNNIYRSLAKDSDFLSLMGIPPTADNLVKAKRIQKRSRPQNIADKGAMPLVAFYSPGGRVDPENDCVYGSVFFFDIYTKDDVDLAHKIASCIITKFKDQIAEFDDLETYSADFLEGFERSTDLQNTYCFSVTIVFYVSIDE